MSGLGDLEGFSQRNAPHLGAAVRFAFDQAFECKRNERGTNGCAATVIVSGQVYFEETVTGFERSESMSLRGTSVTRSGVRFPRLGFPGL